MYKTLRKGLSIRKKGGLEGMPLYLIILVIIAAIAIAILVGFMLPLQKPNLSTVTTYAPAPTGGLSQESTYTFTGTSGSFTLYVVAIGSNSKPIVGATVTISGYGPSQAGTTSTSTTLPTSSGTGSLGGAPAALFTVKYYSIPGHGSTYTLSITVSYTGVVSNTITSNFIIEDS
ncbi:MAG: hypothetical protein M1481_05680 [Candidatus Thermoplasmatota archaeon]|jgi:hypothetical protein|nr:hypothetical protein [Candidatus Thermoplasmatota archaeon]MCL5963307.1 hypothetical protein [Candidatus Thermoplasmatota archaeon]